MNEEIIKDDALRLGLEIQKRQCHEGNIIFESHPINEEYEEFTFTYKYSETPFFLEKEGLLKFFDNKKGIFHKTIKGKAGAFIITLDPNAATDSGSENAPKYKQFLPGFYSVSFKLNRINKWLKKELDCRLEPDDKMIQFFTNRDYFYGSSELHIKQRDDTPCTLDFSKSPILRPVFETFYYLYNDGKTNLFTKEELIKKYRELTGKDISWTVFMNRKSSICGKMINTKACLKRRINWEYDSKEKKHRFEILPLSDALSDDRMKK